MPAQDGCRSVAQRSIQNLLFYTSGYRPLEQSGKLTSVSCFLDSMASTSCRQKVWIVGQTEEKGGFLHHLEDGVFDGGSIRVRKRVKIKGDDCNAIRELL